MKWSCIPNFQELSVCFVKLVKLETLCMIYYVIFSSIMMYGSQIWGQHNRVVKKLQVLQNKALRIMNFSTPRTATAPLFKNCNILKLSDNIMLQNILFAHDSLKNNLPPSLSGKLSLVDTVNNTLNEMYYQLDKLTTRTILYGTNSIKSKSVDNWNFINNHLYHEKLHEKSRLSFKEIVKKFLISCY